MEGETWWCIKSAHENYSYFSFAREHAVSYCNGAQSAMGRWRGPYCGMVGLSLRKDACMLLSVVGLQQDFDVVGAARQARSVAGGEGIPYQGRAGMVASHGVADTTT